MRFLITIFDLPNFSLQIFLYFVTTPTAHPTEELREEPALGFLAVRCFPLPSLSFHLLLAVTLPLPVFPVLEISVLVLRDLRDTGQLLITSLLIGALVDIAPVFLAGVLPLVLLRVFSLLLVIYLW